jgi:phosphodiesterase/alkaline phosphatase D-like protein
MGLSPAAQAAVVFDGVAAGDVSSTDAILWTRADNGGSTTSLTAQVATDPGFTNIVDTLNATTSADSDFTLKLDATGLASNTRYYYRSLVPDDMISPTGHSRRHRQQARRSLSNSGLAAIPTPVFGLIRRSPISHRRS